jgi:hypothetical protein
MRHQPYDTQRNGQNREQMSPDVHALTGIGLPPLECREPFEGACVGIYSGRCAAH